MNTPNLDEVNKWKQFLISGKYYNRIPNKNKGKCKDCGVTPGSLHKIPCQIEKCPRCTRCMKDCKCEAYSD